MSSTLLFGLGMDGVTARLWSHDYGQNAPPDSFDASIGYPGVWDVRCTSVDEQSIGFQGVPQGATRVWFRKPGYGDQPFSTIMPDDGAKEIRLTPTPLSALHIDGMDFKDFSGRRIVLREVTNFMQFYHFELMQDMTPSLYDGFDLDRTTLTMKWIPEQIGLPPLNMAPDDLQVTLAAYGAWKRSLRRRSELTVLCDMADMGIAREQQARILNAVYEVAADFTDVFLVEFGNEVLDGENRLDLPYLVANVNRRGVLSSSGSGLSGGVVPEPYLDYCTPHLNRGGLDKMLADANFGEQVYGSWPEHPHPTRRPMLTNEMIGADEARNDGSRSTDPNIFKEVARAFRSRNGGCFHATDAVFSRALGPTQDKCRAAFIEGSTD